ncbi:MAG TPA: SRPBCC family protein [Polyangiaceae bacterium]|nr:SRPBCC family protein [Polyangiaceae bacterium]
MTTTLTTSSLRYPARAQAPRAGGGATNVHPYERATSLVSGGALVVYGLSRRDPLGLGLALVGGGLAYRGARGVCPLYSALGVSTAPATGPVFAETSITIFKTPAELYALLSDPEELSRLFGDALRVERTGGAYRWSLRVPGLGALDGNAGLIEEVAGEAMTWRTRPGGPVEATMGVRVVPAPAGRGSELTLTLRYDGGASGPGAALGRLLAGGAKGALGEVARRVRQRAEAGETPSIAGQPAGRRTLLGRVTP